MHGALHTMSLRAVCVKPGTTGTRMGTVSQRQHAQSVKSTARYALAYKLGYVSDE